MKIQGQVVKVVAFEAGYWDGRLALIHEAQAKALVAKAARAAAEFALAA